MHKLSVLKSVFAALLLLLWATGGVMAAPPAQEPTGDVSIQAAVSTAFIYQGNLTDGVSPANGPYDFDFTLFDDVSAGSQVGSPVLRTITVTDGLFSVELDFGNVFDGTALWLEISVQPNGGSSPTILDPRQPLTATPYAHYALDGWGGSWTSTTGTDTGLTLSGGQTGLNGSGTLFGVYGQSDAYGVYGETFSGSGVGVRGYSNATSGINYGVRGKNLSPSGFGVYGENASATAGTGVYGESDSTTGKGVSGLAKATTGSGGTSYGVYGKSDSSYSTGGFQKGYGVYGEGSAAGVWGKGMGNVTHPHPGVLGTSDDTGVEGQGDNIGVEGTGAYGVQGSSNSSTGRGVYGNATAGSGLNYGVYGQSASSSGFASGVYGYGSAKTSNNVNFGVHGVSDGGFGTGVYGVANDTGGINSGVTGLSMSPNGIGVVGRNLGGGLSGLFETDLSVNGKVGIGVTNPTKAKVEINGSSNNTIAGTNGYFNSAGLATTAVEGNYAYSLYATDLIASQGFIAFSDERMKQIEGRSDAAQDLVTLAGIEVTDYSYIDTVTKGVGEQKKVIAQQVETVYPQAVNRSTDVVPDIYQKAPVEDGWVELVTDLQVGEHVRLIGEETQGVYEVLEVTSDGFRTDFVADSEAVFVYGREVDDFRSVDYEAISMLNVSATQELNRLVEQQAAEIEALNTRLSVLEQAGASAQSNAPFAPWLLFGGLGVVGLVFVQKRRVG